MTKEVSDISRKIGIFLIEKVEKRAAQETDNDLWAALQGEDVDQRVFISEDQEFIKEFLVPLAQSSASKDEAIKHVGDGAAIAVEHYEQLAEEEEKDISHYKVLVRSVFRTRFSDALEGIGVH